jgi:hypothetical protein
LTFFDTLPRIRVDKFLGNDGECVGEFQQQLEAILNA